MSREDEQLSMMPIRQRVGPFYDLSDHLPDRVWPTPLSALVQNGEVLIVRVYEEEEQIGVGHDRLWKTLSRKDGTTVLCVWGRWSERRKMQLYLDGHAQPVQSLEPGDFGRWVAGWWQEATRLR